MGPAWYKDAAAFSCCRALGTAPGGAGGVDFSGTPPSHAKPTARLSAGFIISQDLWRKNEIPSCSGH